MHKIHDLQTSTPHASARRHNGKRSLQAAMLLIAATYSGAAGAVEGAPPKLTTLWSFDGSGDGSLPNGGLVFDRSGNAYGTTLVGGLNGANCGTLGCGIVYQLKPPAVAGGSWTETILHQFTGNGDGSNPVAGVILGPGGELYGTTAGGGAGSGCGGSASSCGTVFELQPPAVAGGTWTESVLLVFAPGVQSQTSLLLHGGALYGSTFDGGPSGAGSIFELTPPAAAGGTWTATTLYTFTDGADGATPSKVVFGKDGSLYGTAGNGGISDGGVVFQLTPPAVAGGSWTETVLYSFLKGAGGKNPFLGVITDSQGRLFGPATFGNSGNGTLFKLNPPAAPGGTWAENTIYRFKGGTDGSGPSALALKNGSLYGATVSGGTTGKGTVFRLNPPATVGASWKEIELHQFSGGADGGNPEQQGLTLRGKGIYGATANGGANGGGTVFEIIP